MKEINDRIAAGRIGDIRTYANICLVKESQPHGRAAAYSSARGDAFDLYDWEAKIAFCINILQMNMHNEEYMECSKERNLFLLQKPIKQWTFHGFVKDKLGFW